MTFLGSVTWMLVVFTVVWSAAEENAIWIVALAETWLAPDAGVIDATEKAVDELLTGASWPPPPQPIKGARDKAAEETKIKKRSLVRSFISATTYRLGCMVANPSLTLLFTRCRLVVGRKPSSVRLASYGAPLSAKDREAE